MKRILLFVATNVAIMVTVSIVLAVLGIGGYRLPGGGLNYSALMVISLIWGMTGSLISLAISRIVAKRAMGVQLVDGRTGHEELDWLYATVRQLTERDGLPMPEVGFYESPEVNAFATGPSKSRSLVAVSSGLLRSMRRDEVEGVLAHEVSHIANGDMVTMTLIQGVVNAFVFFLSRVIASLLRRGSDSRNGYALEMVATIVLQIVLGVLASIIVNWFSRAREFRADAGSAALAGRHKMIAALERLQQKAEVVDNRAPSLATMKINGGGGGLGHLFSSHPSIESRIAALRDGQK